MIKHVIAAALVAAAFSATPAAAQDAAANQCRATATNGHVKVFDGATGQLSQQPRETAAGYDGLLTLEGIPGERKAKDSTRTARELGSRAAVGRRRSAGGLHVAAGDVNGDGATAAARMQCSNNLKQLGTAAH